MGGVDVLQLCSGFCLDILESRVGNERDGIAGAMRGEFVLGEKQVRTRRDAKIASPVADIDVGCVRCHDGAFADPRSSLAGGLLKRCFQSVIEAVPVLFDTEAIGDNVEMAKSMIGQDAVNETIDPVADDGYRDRISQAPADEFREFRIDFDRVEKFIYLVHGCLDERDLCTHALPRVDPSCFPGLLYVAPLRRGKPLENGIRHVDRRDRAIKIAIGLHQRAIPVHVTPKCLETRNVWR